MRRWPRGARPGAALGLALLLAASPLAAQQRPRPPEPPVAAVYRQAPMDAVSAMMAYHSLGGHTPDFGAYVERTPVYRNATAFDRDQIRAREVERLEGLYRRFDPDRLYLVRLNTQLRQYDTARRGYAIPLVETSYAIIQDPVMGRQYGVQFRNPEDINFIAIPDVNAARALAQRFTLDMQRDVAAQVVVEIAFRVVESGPEGTSNPILIRADAVSARVLKDNRVLHEFRETSVAARPPAPLAAGTGALRAADVQGLRIGMPAAQARGIGERDYPLSRALAGGAGQVFLEGGAAEGEAAPPCGAERPAGAPGQRADAPPALFTVPDSAEACLAYRTAPGGTVAAVTSGQRVPADGRDDLRAALEEKYGPPSLVQGGGSILVWRGRPEGEPGAPPVQIQARFQEVGQGALRQTLLGIELVPLDGGDAPRAGGARPRL